MSSTVARYFFHIVKDAFAVIDPEGTELPSLDVARAEALEDARALMSAAIIQGFDISVQSIQICNETGVVLMDVPFRDAIVRP